MRVNPKIVKTYFGGLHVPDKDCVSAPACVERNVIRQESKDKGIERKKDTAR